jgi:hypothetical protein
MLRISEKKGFTLIETIVASTILCGSVLTIGAICSRALVGTRLNRQYETALAVIDRQFSLIDYYGIDEFIETGELSGEFEDYGTSCTWIAVIEYQELDALYSVAITAYWYEHTKLHQVSIETRFDGISQYASSSTEESTGTTQQQNTNSSTQGTGTTTEGTGTDTGTGG